MVEKLICFELNVENECQGKVISKQESPSFSLGKMSKGHADIYGFFLSTLFLNKNLPKPTGCHFLMEICFDKNFLTSFTSYAQTFPRSIPIWFWQGVGVRTKRGYSFQNPSVMYRPVKGPNIAKSILLPGKSQTKVHSGWLADLGRN